MEKIIQSVIFDDAHKGVLEALAAQHGALEVKLFHETDNRHHDKAIAICSALPAMVVGGAEKIASGNGQVFQRLGFVARAEPEHARLFERIKTLALKYHSFWLRHGADTGLYLVCRKEEPMLGFIDSDEDLDPEKFWEPHTGWH